MTFVIRVKGMDLIIDLALAYGSGHINVSVHTLALGQSIYPGIALLISYYYVYFIEELWSYKLSYKVMCTNTDDEVQAITVNARQ